MLVCADGDLGSVPFIRKDLKAGGQNFLWGAALSISDLTDISSIQCAELV